MSEATTGRLEAIWIKRANLGPMDPVEEAEVVAGAGLVNNANQGGHRQVTLLAAEAWKAAEADLDSGVDPRARRANLFLSGIELAETRGRVLEIGNCRIHINGETRPCERMNQAHAGLREALDPDWRAGAYGEALDNCTIRVGDPVRWVADG
jgi:MOSC domain-containing protein YiiM